MKILDCDICIYGGNAGGVSAACTAAECGWSVTLVENTAHPGGMTASGLGETDYNNAALVGGFAGKFYAQIRDYYEKQGEPDEVFWHGKGWTHEPHVAEDILRRELAKHHVNFLTCHRLGNVQKEGGKIISADFDYARPEEDGSPRPVAEKSNALKIKARMFIDASYEGDLLAKAGCSYVTGREGTSAYGEELAGVRPVIVTDIDPYRIRGQADSGLLPLIQADAPGETGSGDEYPQAYNFRLCISRKSRIPFAKPENYDASRYEIYGRKFADWEKKGDPMLPWQYHIQFKPRFIHPRVLKFSPLPNGKMDVNNCSFGTTDMIGYSKDYPEADWTLRSRIWKEHIEHIRGLLHFLCTDERLRPEVRAELSSWGLAADEFSDTGNWPFQLYVRQARRMKGVHVMTAIGCNADKARHSVGRGSYPLDSHFCRRFVKDGRMAVEGSLWSFVEKDSYGIEYEALIPNKTECENLLVNACLSASHVAFSSMRMEPVMMILGESVAVAASIALRNGIAVQEVAYSDLKKELLSRGQVL